MIDSTQSIILSHPLLSYPTHALSLSLPVCLSRLSFVRMSAFPSSLYLSISIPLSGLLNLVIYLVYLINPINLINLINQSAYVPIIIYLYTEWSINHPPISIYHLPAHIDLSWSIYPSIRPSIHLSLALAVALPLCLSLDLSLPISSNIKINIENEIGIDFIHLHIYEVYPDVYMYLLI